MARRAMVRAGLFMLLLASLLAACGGGSDPYNTTAGGYVTIDYEASPTPMSTAPTMETGLLTATPAGATATSTTPVVAEVESPQDVFVMMEQALTREGSVYHARIEQVIKGMSAGGTPQTGETVMFPTGIYLVTADGSVATRLTSTLASGLDWGP